MSNDISCKKLLLSWVLVFVGVLVVSKYLTTGLLIAAIPFGIAAKIREEHDKALLRRVYANKGWQYFALSYYLVVLAVVLFHAREALKAPLPLLAGVLLLPLLVPMIRNDIRSCRDDHSDLNDTNNR